MITNENCIDRCIRVLAGAILLTSFYFMQNQIWLLIGIIPLVTGFIGFCPLYKLLGFSTEKTTQKRR